MKNYIFTLLIAVLLFSSAAYGVASNRVYYHIDIVDQFMQTITSPVITQVDVQNESGAAVAVYTTKSGTTEVGSTGVITTGLTDGRIEFWYADTAIDLTVTDGTRSYEIESYSVRTARFMLPSFLVSTSSSNFGQTNDIDFTYASWIIDGDTTNRLDMIPDNDGAILAIGDATTQADFYIYSASLSDYWLFDEGAGEIYHANLDLQLDNASYLYLGTSNVVSLQYDGTNFEIFSSAADTPLALGGTSGGFDLTYYFEDAGQFRSDYDADFINLTDDMDLRFGTGATSNGDIQLSYASGNVFTIGQIAAGVGTIAIGVNDAGIDFTHYGDTTGNYVMWDTDQDTWTGNLGNVLYTTVDAEANQFKVDATGTANGFAVVLETTDGGVQINADGSDNGDVTIDAADILTLTSADTKIFDGASAETWIIEGAADASEATVVFTNPTADVTYTIPVMAADTVSFMLSTLETNAPDIANSVTGGTNQLIFEGSDADTEESIITAADPTADIVWTLPDAGAMTVSFMASSLTTNMPEVANSVTGGTNQLIFEGSSEDAYETILTVTNPTQVDKTITIPNASSGNLIVRSYTAHTTSGTMNASPCWGGVHTNTGASGAIELEMPSAVAGMEFSWYSTVACPVSLDAATGDQILGLTDTVADKITSGTAAGKFITLFAIDNTNWVQTSVCGPWADGGA